MRAMAFLLHRIADPAGVSVAFVGVLKVWELVGLAAVAVMLLGLWLSWRRQSLLADIEEDVKNIKLTSEQAWRKSRWVTHAGPVVIVVGMLMLIVAMAGFAL